MYKEEFVSIYEKYGWNDFAITMAHAIKEYLKKRNIVISSHLDLCSGTGELCHFFESQGVSSKGVDLSFDMVALAKKKYKNIPFIVENILDFKDKVHYDLVTCTCDSINHLLGEKDLETLLLNVHSVLKEKGLFIFDIVNKEKIEFNKSFLSKRGEGVVVHYCIQDLGKSLINLNMKVFKEENLVYEENIKEKIYEKNEVIHLLEQNSFDILKCDTSIEDEKQRVSEMKIYFIARRK